MQSAHVLRTIIGGINFEVDVVENEPKFCKQDLAEVCKLILQIASNKQLVDEGSPRQMALEFLVAVAEKLHSHCRKMETFVANVFAVKLEMMLELKTIVIGMSKKMKMIIQITHCSTVAKKVSIVSQSH